LGWIAAVLLGGLHAFGLFLGLGGWQGLTSPWPIPRDDHPMHFHNAVVAGSFLRETGRTAGYDPSFMAGYPLSVVSDPSNNLAELLVGLIGRDCPEIVYKAYVFGASALVPFLIAACVWNWGGRGGAALAAVALALIYAWTDFPLNYVSLGMVAYFLVIPLSLLATAWMVGYLKEGGFGRWLLGLIGGAISLLVHPLGLMVLVPALVLAYFGAVVRGREPEASLPSSRHLGIWLWPLGVLAANVWWWLPWYWLADGAETPAVAFYHPEPIGRRLWEIFVREAPIQAVLIAAMLPGMAGLWRRDRILALALGGFILSGFTWGYLAGAVRALDGIQPGRHTYAFYTGAAVAGGLGWQFLRNRFGDRSQGLRRWATVGVLLVGLRLFGYAMHEAVAERLTRGEPFLSSRPTSRLTWMVERLKTRFRPGERLLYEEGGRATEEVADPFQGHRYGGLLPRLTGLEVIGGPFLHVPLKANHAQFGEGKLFGQRDWGRDDFVQAAEIYRPEGILCWSPRARAFCRDHPDLIEILDDDGFFLLGRVLGYGGAASRGSATVRAQPGRLIVDQATAGVDGRVVLRYHFDPYLQSRPPTRLEPVSQGGDPVPFVGFRPVPGQMSLVLDLPP
jgi:hypothetical protein